MSDLKQSDFNMQVILVQEKASHYEMSFLQQV